MTAIAVMGILLAACNSSAGPVLTLYNGQHTELTAALADRFTAESHIAVAIRSNDGVVLADQLLSEGSHSPADVYFTENSPELMNLEDHHLLAKLPARLLSSVPSEDVSPGGEWIGVALRISCMVYNPSLVTSHNLPRSLLDLAESKWDGKIAIAPTDSDFVPLVGAMLHADGPAATRSWLAAMKSHAHLYQNDESVTNAVNDGEAAIGIINQYYWYRLRLEVGTQGMHSSLAYFPNHDVGSVINISGIALLAHAPHPGAGLAFIRFVVSSEGQKMLASGDDFEYPVLPGVAPNAALPPLSTLPTDRIPVTELGNDEAAATLLQTSGLS